jgi:hypothetical protein
MAPWQWVVAVLAGAVGQFLDTLAGMGFGALAGSVMLAGGLVPAVVVGTVSVAKVGSGLISGAAHWRANNVRPQWALLIAVPGMIGGCISAYLLTGLPVEMVRVWVPVVLFVMGLLLLRRFLWRSRGAPMVGGGTGEPVTLASARRVGLTAISPTSQAAWLMGIGFVAGIVNGLSGAFGPVATTAVTLKIKGHPRYAIGSVNTAEFFVALAVSVTIFTRLDWQAIDWQIPLALIVGSLFTAPLGAYLTSRMPARVVGVLLALVLLGLNGIGIARAML